MLEIQVTQLSISITLLLNLEVNGVQQQWPEGMGDEGIGSLRNESLDHDTK